MIHRFWQYWLGGCLSNTLSHGPLVALFSSTLVHDEDKVVETFAKSLLLDIPSEACCFQKRLAEVRLIECDGYEPASIAEHPAACMSACDQPLQAVDLSTELCNLQTKVSSIANSIVLTRCCSPHANKHSIDFRHQNDDDDARSKHGLRNKRSTLIYLYREISPVEHRAEVMRVCEGSSTSGKSSLQDCPHDSCRPYAGRY